MANSDAGGVRHVRCPRCHGVLREPSGVPVYQCGGCGATLRAKNRSGDARDAASGASPSTSTIALPPPQTHQSRRRLASGDVAGTGRSTATPHARSSEHQLAAAATGDLEWARKHGSSDVASTSSTPPHVAASTSGRQQDTHTGTRIESGSGDDPVPSASNPKRVSESESEPAAETKEHDQQSTPTNNRGANSEFRRQRRDTGDAPGPGAGVTSDRGTKEQAPSSELQVGSPELPVPARQKHSDEAAAVRPQFRDGEEPAPSRDHRKVPSPPPRLHEDLAPLRQKILKTVDDLKGDLSELFSKSPDFNPATRARPPRLLPKQQGHASRGAAASTTTTLPASGTRTRHAAAASVNHHGSRAARPRHDQVAAAAPPPPRGLPSRRYRRCRADPCCDNVQPRSCHHGCCRHHGRPECGSCRGHCGRPTRQEPSAPRKEPKRRPPPPPRNHCRPVLKGAPFIICSTCFTLVQVPADFAVSTNRLRKLRCGSCSTVLSYSYKDPARKKKLHHHHREDFMDHLSTDDKGYHAHPDPFDAFGLSSHSTTEDEQPLHVSRNTSFDTVDGVRGVGRLHRLMGYGSASELLRHSPDLYESLDERTTPDQDYDRKGKGVCIDDAEDDDSDDSDDEAGGVLKRSAARGAVWPLPGTIPPPGAIRIKS